MTEPNVLKIFKLFETSGDFGIEIEVESDGPLPTNNFGGWVVTNDGSLRGNAFEYVLRRPAKGIEGVEGALGDFINQFEEYQSSINDSVRAGVHIHVNCQELTMKQVFTFITCYLLIEDVMVDYCGEGRQGNLFCLRLKDAEHLAHCLAELATTRSLAGWRNEDLRYSSCNITSIPRYGSLEFRALRTPTLDNFHRINVWAKALGQLKVSSMEYKDPRAAVEDFNKLGPLDFLSKVLGESFQDIVSRSSDPIMSLITNMRNTKDVAYSTDWDTMSYTRFIVGEDEDEQENFTPPTPVRGVWRSPTSAGGGLYITLTPEQI